MSLSVFSEEEFSGKWQLFAWEELYFKKGAGQFVEVPLAEEGFLGHNRLMTKQEITDKRTWGAVCKVGKQSGGCK